jgi:hypothetical protein
MMGRQRRDQGRLFYEFRLEDRIPDNHLLRRINVFVTSDGKIVAATVPSALNTDVKALKDKTGKARGALGECRL